MSPSSPKFIAVIVGLFTAPSSCAKDLRTKGKDQRPFRIATSMPDNTSELLRGNRRDFLTATSAALLSATLPAVAQDKDDAAKADHDASATDPGPENQLLRQANPNTFLPPTTDHGEVQTFWSSFSVAHRRIQEGGWSRQITVQDFPISKEIAGVNMRLTAGGIREMHWHQAAEWSLILSGSVRLTAIDNDGRSYVRDLVKNDLWYFPPGTPHSIQGLAPEGSEFLLVFDDGTFSEGNTTLVSDWARHTPPEILAKNFGVPLAAIEPIYKVPSDGHYIFQTSVPPPIEQDIRSARKNNGPSSMIFDFPMHSMKPTITSASGEVRIIDSHIFPISATIAAAHVTIKPGGMRELHWHQNASEWQYYLQGQARMTVFFNGGKARTADFNAGDVGYVPHTYGHYIENTGSTDLVFLEMFRSNRFQSLSLSQWLSHTPPELVMQHLNLTEETLRAIPKAQLAIVPA